MLKKSLNQILGLIIIKDFNYLDPLEKNNYIVIYQCQIKIESLNVFIIVLNFKGLIFKKIIIYFIKDLSLTIDIIICL